MNRLLKAVALVVILGVPVLLVVGFFYDILSPREWGIGFLSWFAALLLWAIVRKLVTKKTIASNAEPAVPLDDRTRTRVLRGIWVSKVWIGLLATALPFGIANGVTHRAWLPTSVGVVMSLLTMYVAMRTIKRQRKRLNCTRQRLSDTN